MQAPTRQQAYYVTEEGMSVRVVRWLAEQQEQQLQPETLKVRAIASLVGVALMGAIAVLMRVLQ